MLLRRVVLHFRKQEWTAIAIDFVIVVFGVFVGIQVANWNEDQAEQTKEKLLLGELRGELVKSIEQIETKITAYQQVGRSGERAITFLDSNANCKNDCLSLIVDFLHASQWQQIFVSRSTYDEIRRNGWPRNRNIVAALEAYHLQAAQISLPQAIVPPYRSLVRGLIPLAAQNLIGLVAINYSMAKRSML
ncbi:MAG: hypothetical protein ACI88A_001868 [Paraglaciecola sp.]|jgi:hypothetical protein